MSAATQFFGGGAGGDAAPANGTDIRFTMVAMGGGGGAAFAGGGAGRLVVLENGIVATGSTFTIDIGAFGSGVPVSGPSQPGTATTVSLNTPLPNNYGYFGITNKITAEGGGGGGASLNDGSVGGSGGGGGGAPASNNPTPAGGAAIPSVNPTSTGSQSGKYFHSIQSYGFPGGNGNPGNSVGASGGGAGGSGGWGTGTNGPGITLNFTGSDVEYCFGGGTGALSPWAPDVNIPTATEYGSGGFQYTPTASDTTKSGLPGAVFIRYPTIYAEASAVSGHDTGISTSVTPGYYTYVWHDPATPGSITF